MPVQGCRTMPSAEAQVAAIADDIAYNDLVDGLRAGLFTLEDLRGLPLIGASIAAVDLRAGRGWRGGYKTQALRRLLFGLLVEDVLAMLPGSGWRWRAERGGGARARAGDHPLFEPTFAELKVIRDFLYRRMYRHWAVQRMRRKARMVVEDLFRTFARGAGAAAKNACAALGPTARARVVAGLYRRDDRPLRVGSTAS